MSNKEISDLRSKIIQGLDLSLQRLIKDKKSHLLELAFSKKGKIIHIKAADL